MCLLTGHEKRSVDQPCQSNRLCERRRVLAVLIDNTPDSYSGAGSLAREPGSNGRVPFGS